MIDSVESIPSDELLFDAIVHSDRSAFESLFQKYYVMLCNYCLTYLQEKDESEDAVQDIFVYLWNNRTQIELQGAVKSYLFSSVKHRALNILKHKAVERSHYRLLSEFLEDLANTDYSDEEQRQLEQIRKVIQDLPVQCRTVFRMSCLEGKKYKEIAEELQLSVNTVKSHISKAYQLVRDKVVLSSDISVLFFISCMASLSWNEKGAIVK